MSNNNLLLGRLHWSDVLVILLYYIISLGIGIYTICKTKNTIDSVFLAGRSLTWWSIGLSLFASNIGSINFVGIAGTSAASGIAVVSFEWAAVYMLILLGWVFVPVYMSSQIYTVPEYLHKRFGGQRLRVYLSVIALLTYIFAILSVDLFSGALFIQHSTGLNIYIGVAVILGTTILFTVLGGLMTVVLTDAFAVIVMIFGGVLLFIIALIKVGGFQELERKYMNAVPNETLFSNSTCGYPREDAFHIFRDNVHADFPGLALFVRTMFGGMWFWCSNQLIVQRSLAAKNIVHAKAGSILAGFIKLTPMLIMVIPGMISRALFPEEVACGTPESCEMVCGNRNGCSNIAYPKLVTELLPHGVRGLVIAAMLAAVISSATSIFNSSSSIVTIDIWQRIRPNAKKREQMIVSRVFLVILMAVSVAWIPTLQNAEGGQIYRYATAATGLFGGPTCGMFLMAVLWGRMNEKGAFWSMIIGQVWGLIRFILDIIYPVPPCGEYDSRPVFLRYWHVYYHIGSQILITMIFAIIISLLTKAPKVNDLAGVTFWTRFMRNDSVDDNEMQKECFEIKNANLINIHDKERNVEDVNIVLLKEKNKPLQEPDEQLKVDCIQIMSRIQSKNRMRKMMKSLWYIFCQGNGDKYEQYGEEVPSNLMALKESNFCAAFLNVIAFILFSVTTFLYIYFR